MISCGSDQAVAAVRQWVESVVVEMNLCPFARRELVGNRVRFVATEADTEAGLLQVLQHELEILEADPAVETTLLIHPRMLSDFHDYNAFLDYADSLLADMDLVGVYQIASFHPDYQFAGTAPGDAENYSNRSPRPLLHLLREASLERAIDNYPDVGNIPARNIELMNRMGVDSLRALLDACSEPR